jgi:adenosylcobinamide-GDP ribazoletransferase
MSVVEKIAYTASCVTTLPFLEKVQERRKSPSGLAIYLPAVGLIIGLILAALAWSLSALHVNQLLTGVVLSIAWLIVTGGIHLDGLMDTADGIFSHQGRERMLEIMKDSRVGNFGVMSGFVVLILKCACLSSIPTTLLPVVLLLQPIWSRWCEVLAIGGYPYLRREGLGKVWHDTTKSSDVLLALFVPFVVSAALLVFGFTEVLVLSFATVAVGWASAYYFNKRLEGHTGDTYGATVELSEAFGLLIFALVLFG